MLKRRHRRPKLDLRFGERHLVMDRNKHPGLPPRADQPWRLLPFVGASILARKKKGTPSETS